MPMERAARSCLLCSLAAAALFAARASLAQGGPPFVTDDPGTPGNRRWEINLAFASEFRGAERTLETPLLDANYGVGDRIQLKVEIPWIVRRHEGETETGAGNLLLGVKWRFADEKTSGVSVGTYPQLEFNTSRSSSNKGLVERETALLLPLVFQKEIGPVSANAEIGHLFRRGEKGEWILGLALGHDFSETLDIAAEIFATTSSRFTDAVSLWNVGGRWKFANRAVLLASAGSGLSGTSEEPRTRFQSYIGIQLLF
jgi:hypothetical protein